MPERHAARDVGDLIQVGELHGAGMKGGDLVVIQVRGDEGLRGEGVLNDTDVLHGQPLREHAFPVGRKIVTRGGHGDAAIPEQAQ